MDDIPLRRLVVHGWENQGHGELTRRNIINYIHTGDSEYLSGTRYFKIREGLLPK